MWACWSCSILAFDLAADDPKHSRNSENTTVRLILFPEQLEGEAVTGLRKISLFVCSSWGLGCINVSPSLLQTVLCRRALIFSSHCGFIPLCSGAEGSRQRPHRSPLRLPASVRLWGQRLHSRLPKLPQLLQQRGRPGLRLPQRLGPSL